MAARDPQKGDILDGRYVLGAEIGRGAHGVVFSANDTESQTTVAVKVLRQNVADDAQYAVRLWREAQSLQMLWDESVVRVHRFGHDAGGSVFMVMELLEGETLDEHLYNLEDFGDQMSAYEVLRWLDPVARALHTAHSKGIIHRDIKPGNIFRLTPEHGEGVRLMDFGLVKIAGAEEITQAGVIAGSPSYIAPELWRAGAFDHRIDIYSLGAVVFRCLAGRTPFTAANPIDLYTKVIRDERPKLTPLRPDLEPEIDGWVAATLALDRDRRFPYVSTMWNALLRIVMSGRTPSAEKARATFRLPV